MNAPVSTQGQRFAGLMATVASMALLVE